MEKIGLMGGTFDPIHDAHLEMAKAAKEQFALDRILFMTGGNPPHKHTQTDAKIRHHMVKLALAGQEDFVPRADEVDSSEPSYTSVTLKKLNQQYPENTVYFIIGGDSLRDFFTWHEPEEILRRCVLLVYPRSGYPTQADLDAFCRRHQARASILRLSEAVISSTEIRQKLAAGEPTEKFLPPPVWEYIRRVRLYQTPPEHPEEKLKQDLKHDRFLHSLGVRDTAVKMARLFGADEEKAWLAGLLHDCAKNIPEQEMRSLCEDLEVPLDETEQKMPGLIHPKLGAVLAQIWYGVYDEEIIDAIRWHTIGKPDMGTLAKIIFVADMLEPNRSYPEAEALRAIAFSDLDEAVYACVRATVLWNKKRGNIIHPNAYAILYAYHPEKKI